MNIKYFIPGLIFLAVCPPSQAALRDTSIQRTCSYLDAYGLNTRGWQKLWGTDFFASSPFKEVGPGASKAGGAAYLSYTIDGDMDKAEKLTLFLRVNNMSMSKTAHEEMLKAGTLLAKMALGTALPEEISHAISQGNSASVKVGGTSIALTRTDWSTGKGYHLRLMFE